jgi:serine protease AprX
MSSERTVTDRYVTPAPDDIVSFSVIAKPRRGVSVQEFRKHLSLAKLREFEAPESTLAQVRERLGHLGFEVFNLPSSVVSARGRVDRFEKVFNCKLTKRIRTTKKDHREHSASAIVLAPGSHRPSPSRVKGALVVAVMAPPLFFVPGIPPVIKKFHLRLPGDLAQLTGASSTHRLTTAEGELATGAGVRVAVIDSGFAPHPYFDQHGYNITRLAASDTDAPDVDNDPHGTAVIAALLACAPDVEAFGIKAGDNVALAFDLALALPGLKAISISWGDDMATQNTLSERQLVVQKRILDAVGMGITVIVAAGNGEVAFPAMMPEVIAVGGAEFNAKDKLKAWSGGSSFSSAIFVNREVPDLCAFASDMHLPAPAADMYWDLTHGTSFAAPQVCGIAALLLQKNPALGPEDIRAALMTTATDITEGTTFFKDTAVMGRDRATGAGLVNARQAWQFV